MLQRIEATAHLSVGRGCAFALLAIFTFMIGLAGDFHLSLKAGGYLSLIMCAVLLMCAWSSPGWPYKSTETWLMLQADDRPRPEVAQRIIGGILREAFLRFALHSAWLSVGMLVASMYFPAKPL